MPPFLQGYLSITEKLMKQFQGIGMAGNRLAGSVPGHEIVTLAAYLK
jgi:hypothetical protein